MSISSPGSRRFGWVQDAILNIVGDSDAYGKKGGSVEHEYMCPHQVQDILPYPLYLATVPCHLMEAVWNVKASVDLADNVNHTTSL